MDESSQQPQSTDRPQPSRLPGDASQPAGSSANPAQPPKQPVSAPGASKLSPALLYGLIASLCLIFLTMGTYFGGPKVFVGDIGFLRYPIILILAVIAVLKEKHDKAGQLDFRAAQRTSFTIFAIALAVQGLFTWLLMMMTNPTFREGLSTALAERITASYRSFGATDEQISNILTEEKSSNPFSFGRTLQGLAYNYIAFFLISLLIAALLKTRKSVTPQNRTIK